MFERYTEKARRTIFFARYEASQWGESYIQPAHLLLGLLREDKQLFHKLLHSTDPFPNIAEELRLKVIGEKVSTSVDLPLSPESKRVLVYGAEEAELLSQSAIGTGHLLLGLLREPGPVNELLVKRGLTPPVVREAVKELPQTAQAQPQHIRAELSELHSAFAKMIAQKGPGSEQIISTLRAEFGSALSRRLAPELEPAVVYRVGVERTR